MKILPTLLGACMALMPAWAMAKSASATVTAGSGSLKQEVTVEFLNDNIVKVTNRYVSEQPHQSRAVVMTPDPELNVSIVETPSFTSFTSQTGLMVQLGKYGSVQIMNGNGAGLYDSGERVRGDKRELELSLMGGGAFYGGGERGHKLDLTGDTLVMYNRQNYGYTNDDPRISQMNITVPLIVNSKGYAVFFDDYAAGELIVGNPLKYVTESPDPVTYYFIDGEDLADVMDGYTELTGHQDPPPFWAMGYITSKYGYKTEAETRDVIKTLKKKGYPVDGVVLDLYWYGKEEDMGRLAWDPEQWPTHSKMLADLKKQGVNLVAISQPYVLRNGRGVDNYNELAPKGMFVADSTGLAPQEVTIWVGEGGMFDVSNPDTRAWLRNRYKELTIDGITGWWGDLGEPEVHPQTGRHANGLTARQYHNQYGNDWSEIIYDLFKEEFPNDRLMTMMRGGTAGLQRYSVYPWSTDVSRSWGGLQPQVKIMLNSGLSGLGYMSHDVGGFALDPEKPYDPELYVRWLQLGAFSPILRTHSQDFAEPYLYPDQQDIILPLIKERYRWLPYNYSLALQNWVSGSPLVRPLNYDDPDGPADVEDEYMWGPDVLIAPVLEQGATSREVVLPDGYWVDYNNPTKVYKGGQTISYDAPLSVLPIFIKDGAVIPTADYPMKNTGDYDPSRLALNCYMGELRTHFSSIYEDDRVTADTDKNELLALHFSTYNLTDEYELHIYNTGNTGYAGMPAKRQFEVKMYNVVAPASVTVAGKPLAPKAYKYDPATRTLTFNVTWTPGEMLEIVVKK